MNDRFRQISDLLQQFARKRRWATFFEYVWRPEIQYRQESMTSNTSQLYELLVLFFKDRDDVMVFRDHLTGDWLEKFVISIEKISEERSFTLGANFLFEETRSSVLAIAATLRYVDLQSKKGSLLTKPIHCLPSFLVAPVQ